VRDAVILAGGAGTRLGALAAETPKPLLEVGGHALLDQLVWNLARHGVDRIVVSAGHLADAVERHVGDGSRWGVTARVVVEGEPLGTGGALRLAGSAVEADEFLLLNGDTLFDVNYLDLALVRRSSGADAALALREVPDAGRYGAVTLDAAGAVASFAEKSSPGPGLVSSGVYAMARSIVAELPCGPSSLETGLLPRLAAEGRLSGRRYDGWFVDIGLPDSLAHARQAAAGWRGRRAVLLDRDGVLNVDRAHVHTPQDFEWVPGAVEAVKWLNDTGSLVIVVTNQAGIARGLYSESEYRRFEAWISARLAEKGAHVDAWYHCPHHPTEGSSELTTECECRKPAPGMLLRAVGEWALDPARTLMIGDKDSDLLAAAAAGLPAVRYEGGDLLAFVRAHAHAADGSGC
jgi:D,D-heptose 1,7-bisphosphate phosphatase